MLFFKNLCDQMNRRQFVVNNPVLQAAMDDKLSVARLEEVMCQYVGLVTMITSYLFLCSYRFKDVPAVRDELVRNLGEERGGLTDGYTHHEILNRELMKLGVKPNLMVWDGPTREFLAKLSINIATAPEMFAVGVIYALEATANPELVVVGHVLNEYARVRGLGLQLVSDAALAGEHKVTARSANELTLSDFFCLHIDNYEPGHRDRLADAVQQEFARPGAQEEFITGFNTTLDMMDLWWNGLAQV